MEGAGASIVSHAAETRRMDSADEEPELPLAVQDLIRRVEGKGEPMTWPPGLGGPEESLSDSADKELESLSDSADEELVTLSNEELENLSAVQDLIRRLEGRGEPMTTLPELGRSEFREFFPKSASLSTITGWRSKVRLRVLEAIGNCNTFTHLTLSVYHISRLTASEWEVVFRGFMCSTIFESISLYSLRGYRSDKEVDKEVESLCSNEELESFCIQIGRILNSSSVQVLRIEGFYLSARCWLNLASGLRGNSDSKLQSLDLWGAWKDSSAVKHVADMINSATRLETLRLLRPGAMEEETVGFLSQALIQSSSLKELTLSEVECGAALLLKALAEDDGNRSIERLYLMDVDGLGGCLREVLTSNPSLKKVTLIHVRMSPEEWHQVGEVIRDKARAPYFSTVFDTFEWESIEAFACAASSEVKDPIVELVLKPSSEDELMLSVNLLGGVLRGEIKSLNSFNIWGRLNLTSGTNQDRPQSILPMNGETSVLKRLGLCVGSNDLWKGLLKDLFLCLRGNTSLIHLDLSESELDKEAFRDLMELLQVNLTLQEIDVSGTSWARDGKAALIEEALKLNQKRADGNPSIERLRLWNMNRLGGCLREVLTSNPSLKEVTLQYVEMSPEEWHQLGEVIRDKARATYFRIVFGETRSEGETLEWESIEALAGAASSKVKDPTVELVLEHSSEDDLMLSVNLLGRVLRGEIKSLKSFSIWERYRTNQPRYQPTNQDRLESVLSMDGKTGETSVLKRLELCVGSNDVRKGLGKDLLLCLRGNTSLIHLDLSQSELAVEAFRDLMELLQVNLILQEIDVSRTPWARDGKAALIQEALKQNQKRAVYMSVFREAKLTFGDAKAGRLFLCGSPLAGKTQLRQTLVHGKKWFKKPWAEFRRRTEGIEVEFLPNNDKGQISIWDLAGQEIFRTLQSVLFPQSSNFSVFLFVYSPFCQKTSSNKPESCFEIELEEWLSFITSSTRVIGHNLPQVLVVISHKDKAVDNSLSWAQSIVSKLTKRFARFVDLHPIQECFHVDTRKNKQVIPLKNYIFEIFEKLLRKKSPLVPHLCSELSSLLVKNTKKNRCCPLWSSQEFRDFCAPILTQFLPSSSTKAFDHSRIQKSITSYLNDAGSIISIPNLDHIIVDPNWLTHTLLGELVALGQDFQAQEPWSRDSYSSKDGFVTERDFGRLIEEFLKKQPHGKRFVDREVLENILINLDLCFKVEDTSQYFIPSFIPEHASTEVQKSQEVAHVESMAWDSRVETSKFVGIRIQCEDRRTMSLTAAFFPCFQMFMRRKLISEMHVSEKTMTCSRHYQRLVLDGHQIYIQQDRSKKYVDVLMLCSKHKSREGALNFVMKHFVKELISFCASSKGCPGVALVLGVIQTLCVEMLIPSHMRGTILIEDLKSNFIRSINDKLEDIPLDKSHLEKEDELFNYEHSWPLIEGHTTQVISERARDLLWESDVEAVVNEIRQKRMQQLESFQQDLIQQLGSLQQGLNEVNKDLIHSYPENENMVSDSNFPDVKDSNRTSSNCLSRVSTSVENCETRLVLERIDQVEKNLGQKVDGVDERLRSVQSILQRLEMKVEQILSLQKEVQSTRSDFMSKVDRIVEYSQTFQQSSTPKRPYITNDVGLFYRLSATLHVGTTVRLHLMCESMTGFHPVKDQEGLKIRLDWKDCGWIRKTIEISFKFMHYAVKAGLDVTLGLGQVIPDWADLKSDIVKLDGISDRDHRAVSKGEDSKELREAWLRIQQTLGTQLRDSYSSIFKLYQVKYVRLELGGHAWMCEECMDKGLRTGILLGI
ncbi:hypothetical protein MPTK1_5g20875 [Marchantia polymorpha subsp. ruderalis]